MQADAATQSAVLAAVHEFTEAYRLRDAARLVALIAPDPDVFLFGTGADERCMGVAAIRDQAEQNWAQYDAVAFHLTWTAVSAAASVAWVAAEGVVQASAGGQNLTLPIRFTLVFAQRADSWLLLHIHGSLPASM